MKETPLILRARKPGLRKFSYIILAVGGAAVGWPIAYQYYGTPDELLAHIGFAFPFIMAGGEILRVRSWCKKVPNVLCKDCSHIFPIKTLFKTACCPDCQSKNLVGIRAESRD